jgi:hypothetical protein
MHQDLPMRTAIIRIKSIHMKKNEFLVAHDCCFKRLITYFVCLLFGFMHFRTSINTLLERDSGLWNVSSATICFILLFIGFFGVFTNLRKLRVLLAEYKNSEVL